MEASFAEARRDRLYQALVSRDARFDGHFYAGVVTTGIYCRPTCPAPDPKPINVRYFPCAAAAEQAGFRPCRRCRPETAPGTPAWLGTSATVSRALRLISEGALDRGNLDELATRLGVGARHLRRLFEKHLGASPISVAQSRRIHFAKTLLDQTNLPMREVAFASGFSSVKRFNSVIRATFQTTPSQLRRSAGPRAIPSENGGITLRLPYRFPYDWNAMMTYLGARATPGVEQVEDMAYRRTARVGGQPTTVEVRPDPKKPFVILRLSMPVRRDLIEVVERIRHLFDLEADPQLISGRLGQDGRLADVIRTRPGIRLPGAWDPFELAVRAILGQQVSVRAATTLAGRLAKEYGIPVSPIDSGAPARLFPDAATLAEANVATIGIPKKRAEAIRELSRRVQAGEISLCRGNTPEESMESLTSIPGVGVWTAQYIAMRALGHPDVFLPGDLGVRKALANSRGKLPSEKEALTIAEAWRPWRAYAVLHLWMGPAHRNGKE